MGTGSEILFLFLSWLLGSLIQTLTNKVRKAVVDKSFHTRKTIEAQKLTELGLAGQGCPGEAVEMMPVLAWARQWGQCCWCGWGRAKGQELFSQYSQTKFKCHLPLSYRPKFGDSILQLRGVRVLCMLWCKAIWVGLSNLSEIAVGYYAS